MVNTCTHISNVRILEQLKDVIACSCDTMVNIDTNVGNYFNDVKCTLERKLDYFRGKLEVATQKMNDAAQKMHTCHAGQYINQDGEVVPSCYREENAFSIAQEEMFYWKNKYERARQIVNECNHEIASYHSFEHGLILSISNQRTPEVTNALTDIIEKIYSIIDCDLELHTGAFLTKTF